MCVRSHIHACMHRHKQTRTCVWHNQPVLSPLFGGLSNTNSIVLSESCIMHSRHMHEARYDQPRERIQTFSYIAFEHWNAHKHIHTIDRVEEAFFVVYICSRVRALIGYWVAMRQHCTWLAMVRAECVLLCLAPMRFARVYITHIDLITPTVLAQTVYAVLSCVCSRYVSRENSLSVYVKIPV